MAALRSPKYPSISLPDAIAKVQLVYKLEHRFPADKEVIAQAMGYGGLNGSSSVVISALIKYGLLESVGDQLKVSEDAFNVLIHHQGETERVKAILKAAFLPALFNELRSQYGEMLPSDHSLRVYLIKRGFNPNSVDGVIRSYRDTIEFVNTEVGEVNTDRVQEPSMQVQPYYPTNPSPGFRDDSSITVLPEKSTTSEKVWSFDLSEDCSIRMVLTGHVTKEALENLKAYIDISIKTAPKTSVKQPLLFEEDIDYHEKE